MNRRTVLGASIALTTSLGGCLGDPFGGCPPTGIIEVYFVPEVPDGIEVLDAETRNLTDSEYISQALDEAARVNTTAIRNERENSSETANRSGSESAASELTDSDDGYEDGYYVRDNGVRVAKISSEERASTGMVSDLLTAPDGTYVSYENTTYVLFYSETVC